MDYVGNALVSPGYYQANSGNFTTDQELLSSMSGYTQRGITLAAGQGILPLGTVMGRVTATKLWQPYDSTASDGTETPRGVLRNKVDTGTDATAATIQANIVIAGILKNSLLSGADTTAVLSLNARQDDVLDTFTF
jgi:hypothetical protein